MKNNVRIGSLGEALAVKYLEGRSCRILERNFRRPWGELDIIAKDNRGVLLFVEVKTIKNKKLSSVNGEIFPEDNMSRAKIIKTQRIAGTYANLHPESIDESMGWRIDLITVMIDFPFGKVFTGDFSDLTEIYKYCEIKHFENVN